MMSCCKLLIVLSTLLLSIEMSMSDGWSKCSRTCGTGISYKTVPCHTDDCAGTKREYKVCNTEECPANSIDFRTEQCQKVQKHSISFNNMSDPCKLMCGLPGELPMEKGTAVDGTSCGVSGICVAGTCIPMGCDGVLGSDKRIDNCGRCGATEGVCLHVHCNIKKVDDEYHVKLPAGSTHVKLVLESSTCDFLALRAQNTTFYLNQTPIITISGNKYELSGNNKLTTHGPLHEETLIQIQHCQEHEIECKYYIPVHHHTPIQFGGTEIREFKWVVGKNFTACSQTCGTGTQTSEIYCKDIKNQKRANSYYCKDGSKAGLQPLKRSCYNPECAYEWKESNWTPCTKSCGGGIRKRDVACIQRIDNESASVNSTACLGKKPHTRETCNNHLCHNHWHKVQSYSECSNYCGEGERRRRFICLNAHGKKINDSNCSILTKPREVDKCIGDMCTYRWIKSNWSNCSVACGEGIQTRTVKCHRVADDVVVNESYCIHNISTPKPKTQRLCKGTWCIGEWGYDDWGKCEAPGCYKEGKRYRNIYCYHGNRIARDHPDITCDGIRPPPAEEPCNKTDSCPPKWVVTFAPCNKKCVKIGTLKCIQGKEVVNGSLCPVIKPSTVMKCSHCTPCSNLNLCKAIPPTTKDPFFQELLCEKNCCTCNKTST